MQFQVKIHPAQLVGPEKVKTAVTCPICELVLTVPLYRCQQCGNHFCKDCLTTWWDTQKKLKEKQCVYGCKQPQIKIIKRSATFATMLDLLQYRCNNQGCQQILSYQGFKKHYLQCPWRLVACAYCQVNIKNKEIQQHDQRCQKKPVSCTYCKQMFERLSIQLHQQICEERIVNCRYQSCKMQIIFGKMKEHEQVCPFKLITCEWCKSEIQKRNISEHDKICEGKKIMCPGCKTMQFQQMFNTHFMECQDVQIACQLCDREFLRRHLKNHNLQDCMINTIKELKRDNQRLHQENLHLKMGMQKLEELMENMSKNKQRDLSKSVIDLMREQEGTVLEKDLQRIEYSLKSIQKLKKQQLDSHMKLPHLNIIGWCMFCNQINKRYSKMMEPLLEKKKECEIKLSELSRFKETRRG